MGGHVPFQGSPLSLPTSRNLEGRPPQPFVFSPQTVLAHTGGREARLLWVNTEGCFLSVGSNQVGILSASPARAVGLGQGANPDRRGPRSAPSGKDVSPAQPARALESLWSPRRQPLSLAFLPDDGTGSVPLGQPPVEQLPDLCHTGRLSQVRGCGNSQRLEVRRGGGWARLAFRRIGPAATGHGGRPQGC